jgi:hypothetical protein
LENILRGKINMGLYFGQIYVVNEQKMKVMKYSYIVVILEPTKKKVKFLVVLEIKMKVIIDIQILKVEL